jgi:hypothetical protein
MTPDEHLFDVALTDALSGETFERLMERHISAVCSGDREKMRVLDEILRAATVLGTHAVLWAELHRTKQ